MKEAAEPPKESVQTTELADVIESGDMVQLSEGAAEIERSDTWQTQEEEESKGGEEESEGRRERLQRD